MILPATTFCGSTLALIYFSMTVYVAQYRIAHGIFFGDGGNKEFAPTRHKYTPIVLVLLMLAEFQGSHGGLVYSMGGPFTFGRLMHAFHSLFNGSRVFRVLGMLSTVVPMISLGLILARDGVSRL